MEYEEFQPLTTVRGLGHVCWDALGQFLLVEVLLAKTESGPYLPVPVTLTREAARELRDRLSEALSETGLEESNRQ